MIDEELLKVEVTVGDFGFDFVFSLFKPDKVTPFDLTDYKPHLVVPLLFDAEMTTVGDPTLGKCSYTLEANKFLMTKKCYEAKIVFVKEDAERKTVFKFYIVTI
jgi:hypothetical protein